MKKLQYPAYFIYDRLQVISEYQFRVALSVFVYGVWAYLILPAELNFYKNTSVLIC